MSDQSVARAELKRALASLDDILDGPPKQLTTPELSVVRSHRMAELTRAVHALADTIHPAVRTRT